MFKKIVANLPFNPSMITALGFYGERLKQERSIRRMGFVFIALTMVLQMLVIASPPQRSLAASQNHILNGLSKYNSFSYNKNFLLQAWDNNTQDIRAIYGYFGVTRADIEKMTEDTIHSKNDGVTYWTTGRNSLYGYANVEQQYKDSQITIEYKPGHNIYMRELRAWDIVSKQTGQSKEGLKGTIASTGETFWILYDCGNFTKIGEYVPPPPPPPPQDPINAVCSLAGPVVIKEDDTEVSIPVQVILPSGASVPKGSRTDGLHLGVTTVGGNHNWNSHDPAEYFSAPYAAPDQQSDYVPTNQNTRGLNYYEEVWDKDNFRYRRYYVTQAQNNDFEVTINVRVNKTDKKLVVRLLDRELGGWLPHNSACEVPVVRETPPPPEPPTPEIVVTKTIIDKPSFLKPGDTYTYLIQYRNKVNASIAEDVVITDDLDIAHFTVVSTTPAQVEVNSLGRLTYNRGNLPFSQNYEDIRVTVRLKDEISSGTKVCNASKMTANNASSAFSENVCVSVITPCPFDPTVEDVNNPNCTSPTVICEVVDFAVNRTTRKVTYRTIATSTNPDNTAIKGYDYDFGDDTEVSFDSAAYQHETDYTYAPGEYETTVVVRFRTTGQEQTADQKADCTAEVSFEEDQAVGQSKTVRNLTKDVSGDIARETTVGGNDELEYTLRTTNSQSYERVNIKVEDYIGDILDYAVLDLEHLEEQGGSFEQSSNKVVWDDVAIPANGEVLHSFRVKIKDPVPSTNSPSSMTTNFDCKISNAYGNEITINVDCPLVKGIETLPNTGPGTSLAAMTGVTVVIGYFFSRSRLLAKEVEYVRQDYVSTGGM